MIASLSIDYRSLVVSSGLASVRDRRPAKLVVMWIACFSCLIAVYILVHIQQSRQALCLILYRGLPSPFDFMRNAYAFKCRFMSSSCRNYQAENFLFACLTWPIRVYVDFRFHLFNLECDSKLQPFSRGLWWYMFYLPCWGWGGFMMNLSSWGLCHCMLHLLSWWFVIFMLHLYRWVCMKCLCFYLSSMGLGGFLVSFAQFVFAWFQSSFPQIWFVWLPCFICPVWVYAVSMFHLPS